MADWIEINKYKKHRLKFRHEIDPTLASM